MRILASASMPSVNSLPRKIGQRPGRIHFELPVILLALRRIAQNLIGLGELPEPFSVAGLLVVGMIAGRHDAVHALDGFDFGAGIDLQQIVVIDR